MSLAKSEFRTRPNLAEHLAFHLIRQVLRRIIVLSETSDSKRSLLHLNLRYYGRGEAFALK